jgi:hypothetical protein
MAEAAEAAPEPAELVATTLKVYPVPLVRPVTVQLVVEEVQVNEPGLEVTVYSVITLPPFAVGAFQLRLTWPEPTVPTTPVGTPGTPEGVRLTGADHALVPLALVAATSNSYEVPLVSPEIT